MIYNKVRDRKWIKAELLHGSEEHSLHLGLLLSDSSLALCSSSTWLWVVNGLVCVKFIAKP